MSGTRIDLPHLAARVFGSPLLIARGKLDAILAVLRPRFEGAGPAPMPEGMELEDEPRARTSRGVAVIPIHGTLVRRAGGIDAMSGLTSYGRIAADLDRALADPKVTGIVLEIDSCGGEVGGCFELAEKIRAATARKPIFAAASGDALSAAYALGSAASRLYVERAGSVGSIGVVALHVDESQKDAKEGLRYTYVHAGAEKVDGNPHEPLSDRARQKLQAEVDRLAGDFAGLVAKHRGLDPLGVLGTQAGVFMGEAGVANRLADKVGTVEDAIADLEATYGNRRTKMLDNEKPEPMAEDPRVAELAAKVARAETENADLRAGLEALRAVAAAQKKREIDVYVSELRARAVRAGSPIPEPKLAQVAAAFARGDEETARALGEAFVALAEARGGQTVEELLLPRATSRGAGNDFQDAVLEAQGIARDANGALVAKK